MLCAKIWADECQNAALPSKSFHVKSLRSPFFFRGVDTSIIFPLNEDDKTEKINTLGFLDYNIKQARESFEKNYLTYNLKKYNNNISQVSQKIGMERTALYRKLKLLKIYAGN